MKQKKMKFRSAEEKWRYEQNQQSWEQLKAKYEPARKIVQKNNGLEYSLSNPPGRERLDVPSHSTPGGSTARRDAIRYTGTLIKGIGTMHKSNAVPIIDESQAKDIASMRR